MTVYTVLLLLPDYLREGATPRDDTYLTHVYAFTVQDAIFVARGNAATAMPDAEDSEDFAVLCVFAGYQEDLYDGRP